MERLFRYLGGSGGAWRVTEMTAVRGQPLPHVERVDVVNGPIGGSMATTGPEVLWTLSGVVSNTRYVTHDERARLDSSQPPLGRSEATCAALIPIKKSAAWWNLAQDERRDILESQSRHIETGLRYLPAIARRLQHGRDLGEPFDFLTWFEFSPGDSPAFDDLVHTLRSSLEWTYVERECDIRLVRD